MLWTALSASDMWFPTWGKAMAKAKTEKKTSKHMTNKQKPAINKTTQVPVVVVEGKRRCGAITKKAGRCEKCGQHAVPDERNFFTPHRGKCVHCGGTMRCMVTVLSANGRCHKHAGMTPHGMASKSWKGGGYGKFMPQGMKRKWEEVQKDPDRLSTERDIVALEVMAQDLLEKMVGEGAWEAVRIAFADLKAAIGSTPKTDAAKERNKRVIAGLVAEIEEAMDLGYEDVRLRKEFRDTLEDHSRIASREAKRQIDLKMHLTAEQGSIMMVKLASASAESFDHIATQFQLEASKLNGSFSHEAAVELVNRFVYEAKRRVAKELLAMTESNHPMRLPQPAQGETDDA